MTKSTAILDKIDMFVKAANAPLPKYTRTWGPYSRRNTPTDVRQILIVEHPDGHKETISYPKFILEQHLGHKLAPNETCEHKDFNPLNNSIDNLEVLDRAFHSAQDTRRVKLVDCICQECGKSFQRSPRRLRDKAKRGKKGPFCSKSCAARHARHVQYGKKDKAPCQEGVASEYYRRKIVERADKLASKWLGTIIVEG